MTRVFGELGFGEMGHNLLKLVQVGLVSGK